MFEQGHMQYELDKDETKEPRLVDLVEKALKILKKDDDGFFLLIECMYCYDQPHVPASVLRIPDSYDALKIKLPVLHVLHLGWRLPLTCPSRLQELRHLCGSKVEGSPASHALKIYAKICLGML